MVQTLGAIGYGTDIYGEQIVRWTEIQMVERNIDTNIGKTESTQYNCNDAQIFGFVDYIDGRNGNILRKYEVFFSGILNLLQPHPPSFR